MGVLRHGWRNDPHSKTEHASKFNSYIANVFKANPNVGIIFSGQFPASDRSGDGVRQMTSPKFLELLAAMPPASYFVNP